MAQFTTTLRSVAIVAAVSAIGACNLAFDRFRSDRSRTDAGVELRGDAAAKPNAAPDAGVTTAPRHDAGAAVDAASPAILDAAPPQAQEVARGNHLASPAWPSIAATQTDVGSACGNASTTHVSAVCTTRPSTLIDSVSVWSGKAIPAGTFSQGSDIVMSPGDSVTLTMTATSGDPDLFVKVLGTSNLVNTTSANDAANTPQQTAGSVSQPTVLFVLPGAVPDVTTAVSTTSYDCRPAAPGSTTESCIIYAFKAATLSWGVYANTQASAVNVSSSTQKLKAEIPTSGGGTFIPGSSGWNPLTIPSDSIAVFVLSWSSNTLPLDLDLYVKVNGSATAASWDCRPHFDAAAPPSETCLVTNTSHTTAASFNVFVASPSGASAWIDYAYGLLQPAGACAADSVVNASTNQCCQCAASESPTGCPTNQCGTSCSGANVVCSGNRCCSQSCPTDYTLANGQCAPSQDSCAYAACDTGNCHMIGSAPTCVTVCDGPSSAVCSQQPNKCCDWKCPTGFTARLGDGGWGCL
jgi:hypothetical protein